MPLRISVIVCAHNEARYLPACLYSVLGQTRPPDEVLVIDNASKDSRREIAERVPGVRVVPEPRKGLVNARETARRHAIGDVLVYLDADCRAPLTWLESIERRFDRDPSLIALSAPYRFYDWDWFGRALRASCARSVARARSALPATPITAPRGESRSAHAICGTTATPWPTWWMCGRRPIETTSSR